MARRKRSASYGVEKWTKDRRAWTAGNSAAASTGCSPSSRKRRRGLCSEATDALVKALNENSHDNLPKHTKLKNVVDALQAIWAEVCFPALLSLSFLPYSNILVE